MGDTVGTIETTGPRFAWWPLYLLLLALGELHVYYPTISSGFDRIQTDPCDTVLNHYFLEHTWRWVSEPAYEGTFWSPPFFYPTKLTLTYSENLIGTAPLYWLGRLFGDDWAAFDFWVLGCNGLNFLAMLLVLRWFGAHPVLAAAGAFVFAFGMVRHSQIGHHHLLPQMFGPFAVWYFWRLTQAPTRRAWALLLLFTAWQLFASIHLGWFTCLGLGVWGLFLLIFDRGIVARVKAFVVAHRGFVTLTAILWTVGLGLFFRSYYLGNAEVRRSYEETVFFMPFPIDWLVCTPGAAWGNVPLFEHHAWNHERNLCMGVLFTALLLWLLWWARRHRRDEAARPTALLVLTTLAAVPVLLLIVSQWYRGVSIWFLFYHVVPGANSMRAIGRVTFAMLLLGTVGGTLGLQKVLELKIPSPSRRLALYAGFALLLVADQFVVARDSFDRRAFYDEARRLAAHADKADALYVINSQSGGNPEQRAVFAMWVGRYARTPVVNGYSGREPAGFAKFKNDPWDTMQEYLGKNWEGRVQVLDRAEPEEKDFVDIRRQPAPKDKP